MTDSTSTTIASNGHAAPPVVPMALRDKLEETVDRLLSLLDAMDGDPDMEPSLGSSENHPYSQGAWSSGNTEDREWECEDEGAQCDDEGDRTSDMDFDEACGGLV